MTSSTFRVVTRGLQPGYSAELAAAQLAVLFKCGKDKIAPLLASAPFTVKKGLALDAARKYIAALEKCGCLCSAEEEAAAPPAPVLPLTQQQMLAVIPALRRVAPSTPDRDPPAVHPFTGDLEIVFRVGPDGPLLSRGTLAASMTTPEKLYETAIWNLYARVQPQLQVRQMAHQSGNGAAQGYFATIETGQGLEASCLLLRPVWDAVAAQLQGALRIAVPNPQTCLFCGADDALAFAMMSDIAAETWSESGAGALSALFYTVDPTGRVSNVPGAHLLRTAPNPPAQPLRTAAQLLNPAQHAQASDAALLTLSEARLRQLQPQLFDLAKWPREADREAWLARIRRTLARGDARAAVVLDAAKGIVASYNDELDGVVLLKFDPALSQAQGWQDGTRLLSANSYIARDQGLAADIEAGPADSGRWGNVWPLIADLLTDDSAGLAARKGAIAETEWERAWQLGRRALAARGTARDGRPLRSHEPAPGPAKAASALGPEAAAAAVRKPASRRRQARDRGSLAGCLKNAGIGALCGWAVWGAGRQMLSMPHDGLFYLACFGIAVFGAIGLASLWSAVAYLRN